MQRLPQNRYRSELSGMWIKLTQQGLEWIRCDHRSGTLRYCFEIEYHNSRSLCIEGAVSEIAHSTGSPEIEIKSPSWNTV